MGEVVCRQSPTNASVGILYFHPPLRFGMRNINHALVNVSNLSIEPYLPVTLPVIMQHVESISVPNRRSGNISVRLDGNRLRYDFTSQSSHNGTLRECFEDFLSLWLV